MSVKNVLKANKDMQAGTIHRTKHNGLLSIVKYNGWDSVLVRFVDTGYENIVAAAEIRRGHVRDKLIPTIQGVGFLGGDYYKSSDKGFELVCYDAWCNMLKRCYGSDKRYKSYAGCEVCEEWQDFQRFAEWFHEHHPNDGKRWHMDKDIKIAGSRVYSPEACSFVTPYENTMEMSERVQMKMCTVISPLGEEFNLINVSKFCRENGLAQSMMSRLINGKYKEYKGWVIKPLSNTAQTKVQAIKDDYLAENPS